MRINDIKLNVVQATPKTHIQQGKGKLYAISRITNNDAFITIILVSARSQRKWNKIFIYGAAARSRYKETNLCPGSVAVVITRVKNWKTFSSPAEHSSGHAIHSAHRECRKIVALNSKLYESLEGFSVDNDGNHLNTGTITIKRTCGLHRRAFTFRVKL